MPDTRRFVLVKRFVIVRAGDKELFERLKRQYADDPGTVILYDRRARARRTTRRPTAAERRRAERRFPDGAAILATRGYFVIRPRRSRAFA